MLRLLFLALLLTGALSLAPKTNAIFPYGEYESVTNHMPALFPKGGDLALFEVTRATAAQLPGTGNTVPQMTIILEMHNIELGPGSIAKGNVTLTGYAYTASGEDRLVSFSWGADCVDVAGLSGLFCDSLREFGIGDFKAACETPVLFSTVDLFKTDAPSSSSADTLITLYGFCGSLGSIAFTCSTAGDCYRPPPQPTVAAEFHRLPPKNVFRPL